MKYLYAEEIKNSAARETGGMSVMSGSDTNERDGSTRESKKCPSHYDKREEKRRKEVEKSMPEFIVRC